MTTPSEEEARALIRELNDHAIRLRDYEDGEWDQELIDGWEEAADLLDRAAAALASRVSAPPSEDARVAGLREAADIADRMYAGTEALANSGLEGHLVWLQPEGVSS
ncbi:hypothetical protein [Microbacterium sp. PA5]|uniref:hypothetical protein n=1 Tax=Microbacterium sp. PA5 TaxID=3416654 RepID=UPI003CF25B92